MIHKFQDASLANNLLHLFYTNEKINLIYEIVVYVISMKMFKNMRFINMERDIENIYGIRQRYCLYMYEVVW